MRELQWSFSNKTPNAPQILSFKSVAQDGGSSTPYTPPGFVQGKGKGKGNVSFDKQAGKKQCPAAASYGQQQHNDTNTSSISQPHEARCKHETSRHIDRRLPAPKNKGILHQHNFSSPERQDSPCSNCKLQSIGAKPLAAPNPANCPIVGSTHLSNTIKPSGGPSQFTIFYDGLVCVYDDVSREKAQAIMLLAGNGNPPTHSKSIIAPVPPKVRPPVSSPQSGDGTNAGNSSGLSTPPFLLPPPKTCSGSTSTTAAAAAAALNPVKPAVTISVPSSATDHLDLSKVATGSPRPICEVNQGSVAASSKAPVRHPAEIHSLADSTGAATGAKDRPEVSPVVGNDPPAVVVVPSGAPLTRKASLARFLERRKERVVSASPYRAANNTSECITSNKGDAAK